MGVGKGLVRKEEGEGRMRRKDRDRGRSREKEGKRGRSWPGCGKRGLVISRLNNNLRVFLARGCLGARQSSLHILLFFTLEQGDS